MSFLRNDNFLGSPDTGKNMGFIASQQWRNGIGRTGSVAQLGLTGVRSPRPLDRPAARQLDLGGDTANDRYHHHRGLDYSFVMNRK